MVYKFNCAVCHCLFKYRSESHYAEHCKGARHRKRLVAHQMNEPGIQSAIISGRRACKICRRTILIDEWEDHLSGFYHKKCLRRREAEDRYDIIYSFSSHQAARNDIQKDSISDGSAAIEHDNDLPASSEEDDDATETSESSEDPGSDPHADTGPKEHPQPGSRAQQKSPAVKEAEEHSEAKPNADSSLKSRQHLGSRSGKKSPVLNKVTKGSGAAGRRPHSEPNVVRRNPPVIQAAAESRSRVYADPNPQSHQHSRSDSRQTSPIVKEATDDSDSESSEAYTDSDTGSRSSHAARKSPTANQTVLKSASKSNVDSSAKVRSHPGARVMQAETESASNLSTDSKIHQDAGSQVRKKSPVMNDDSESESESDEDADTDSSSHSGSHVTQKNPVETHATVDSRPKPKADSDLQNRHRSAWKRPASSISKPDVNSNSKARSHSESLVVQKSPSANRSAADTLVSKESEFDSVVKDRSPHIYRLVGLAPNLPRVLLEERHRCTVVESGSEAMDDLSENDQSSLTILFNLIPRLRDKLGEMREEEVVELAQQMDISARAVRGGDVHRAKTTIIDILAMVDKSIEKSKETLSIKTNRGFKDEKLGEMLCPVSLDWTDGEVREQLRKGEVEVTASQFMRGIYENCTCDPDDYEEGLLKNEALVLLAKAILLGPSSVLTGAHSRRPTNAVLMGIKEMTPRLIAYCTCLLRFSINDQESWSHRDGAFDLIELYWTIVEIFEDSELSRELLRWWNLRIFGYDPSRSEKRTPSNLEVLKAQRAAKRARH